MKLCMKRGEHLRISHDEGATGSFTVYVDKGFIHVRAVSDEHPPGTTHVEFHSDQPTNSKETKT